jgi:hypothetical protein
VAGEITDRKIVIVNQAVNYLTIGFCNAFHDRFHHVALITGSIHSQGEELDQDIEVAYINRWSEESTIRKYWSYFQATLKIYWLLITRFRSYEVFFVSIPPMAYLLNLFVKNKFSMVIWDVYPDILKITGIRESSVLYRLWSYLNRISFRRAFKLFTIGERTAELLCNYVQSDRIIILPIWAIFHSNARLKKVENPFVKTHGLEGKFVVQYSGNIGMTHNVELLIRLAEILRNEKQIVFQIIGRGSRISFLKKTLEEKQLFNCFFLPFQDDEMFPYSLSAADLGVVILDERTAKGSIPSKSYNLMSFGIPSLYIASGDSELNLYAEKYKHARCFTENELQQAAKFVLEISRDKLLWNVLSENALAAAVDFKRQNADRFVDSYLL